MTRRFVLSCASDVLSRGRRRDRLSLLPRTRRVRSAAAVQGLHGGGRVSWLRIDDGFAEHYKISELTDREFRVWMRTLCYAARNNGRAGRLTAAMRREIVGLTAPMVQKYVSLGLLDEAEDGVVLVHDWATYNPKDPTAADRAKRYRQRDVTVTEGVTDE